MPNGPAQRTAPLAVVASTDEVLRHPELDERLLDPVERERADRFRREANRRDFVAGHLLVRLCAARLLDTAPDRIVFGQFCPDCRQTGHGRPLLTDRPETGLSLSHTDGVVAAAAGPGPIGIDVEPLGRRDTAPEVLEQVLSPAEIALVRGDPDPPRAFLRLWVRKEALVKIGRAELDTLAKLDLSALPPTSTTTPARHRFEQLHLLDWTDERLGVLVSAVSGEPVAHSAL